MRTALRSFIRIATTVAVSLVAVAVTAQTVLDSPELYTGEKTLYEAAKKEGMVVSFDTGPTWANWAAEFAAFKKRYPEVEIVYNDIGSGATVVALDKARNRPQADTAYYFAASGIDAVSKNVVAPFKPVNFDKLTPVFRDPEGKWFTIHTLTVALVVNTKLVKNVPQSWAAAPYAISLVEKGPNPSAGKLWLNFIMSDMGQGIFAQGFVRPSVPGVKLPDNVADKLPAAPQVRPLDVKSAAAKKADVDKGWAAATGTK